MKKYLLIATQVKHIEALIEAESEQEAIEAFLEDPSGIASYEEPIIEEVHEVH